MASASIAHRRLAAQGIAPPAADSPAEVVRRLGAVQAQDYLGSLWAIGLRQRRSAEAQVERAIADRAIVRTWPMRGTLHFVAAEDVRWMLELLAPPVSAGATRRHRELGLDRATFARSRKLIIRALRDGAPVRRTALYQILNAAGISTEGARGLHILGHLARERLICFGPRDARQPTFVLLDQWVPAARRRTREEASAELAARYFAGHGPATAHDLAWWAGLTVTEARAAIALAGDRLIRESIGGKEHWSGPSTRAGRSEASAAHLLPPFDEYAVAYRDRGAILDPTRARAVNAGGGILKPTIVIDGTVVGTWSRTLARGSVLVTARPFAPLGRTERSALAAAARRYGEFLGLSATLAPARA